ncbi:hypothetical protein EV356DRAFT_502229 [Viridothelium virens]|uniref:Srp40 C-terminal domain-containing protein n=1 Tax=Viridothelium virens TaxID=1048519 RepID=A0A6A6HNW3_VIRVR|nr:hypothetical protein EV356DRAFT_502229 [Viridothelium virens]
MAKRKRADAGKDTSLAAGSVPAKTKGSFNPSTSPESHPPPPLILLVHTFLQNNHYDYAARALSKESKLRSASASFDGAAQELPDLAELYSFWVKQHRPEQTNAKSQQSRSSAEAVASDDDGEENDTSRNEATDEKNSAKNGLRIESKSDSESDTNTSISDASELKAASKASSSSSAESSEENNTASIEAPKNSQMLRKRLQSLSNSSDSSSESDSSSDSGSGSDSESVDEGGPPKKRKLVEVDKQMPAGVDNQASSSESSSDSEGESDGSASTSGSSVSGSSASSEKEQNQDASDDDSASETSTSESDSDSKSDNSSENESDSLPNPEKVPPKVEAKQSKGTLGLYASDSAASASSSTIKGSPIKTTESSEPTDTRPLKRKREDPPVASTSFNNPQKLNKHGKEPFSRIPKDTQVDPRFASNKYVPYDYADRAYQDLSVTKGKGFTKEKNKKKRGSYRGGAIDTTPKGIKFDD